MCPSVLQDNGFILVQCIFSGPLWNSLCVRLTFRKVVIVGGIFLGGGFVCSAFVTRLELMLISYSLVAGMFFRSFPHACFDTLRLNLAHDFVLMYSRSSSSVVILRQFFKELCLFLNLKYRKCAVFDLFLLHALRNWAKILHMTLF